MADVGNAVSAAVTVIALISALAAAAAIFRVNYMKATIDTQRGTIEAQTQRLNEYEEGQHDRDMRLEEMGARLETIKTENATLRGIVTGRQEIAALTDLVTSRSLHLDEVLTRIDKTQHQLLTLLGSQRSDDREVIQP